MKSTASRLPRHFALASAIALGLCASAFAHGPDMDKHGEGKHHDHHTRAEEHFQKLDANKDGKLSKDEIKGQPMLEHNFDRIDANKDGFLAREEIRAAHEARKAERMKNRAEASK